MNPTVWTVYRTDLAREHRNTPTDKVELSMLTLDNFTKSREMDFVLFRVPSKVTVLKSQYGVEAS